MLGFQGGVSIPLVKGGVKAPPAKRQCRAGPKAGARHGFTSVTLLLSTDIGGAHTLRGSLPTDMLTGYVAPRNESASVQHRQGSGPYLVLAELLPTISCIGRSVSAG